VNNAVAVMRVSSEKQDFTGDSIDHQKDQIDLYASTHNIYIKKYFIFIESASKEQQPVQEAIDYCKNPKNKINLFIIKSIDRFTRGGSSLYDHMKTELHTCNVRLVDLYGVINHQTVNTLEHLGVEYSWSVFSPSKKSELLEAERGKDELRDIMSRMIGAEIRYTRLGYRVRGAPLGYQNQRIETVHGQRFILAPHPIESIWIIKMYELKAEGLLTDQQIVDHINLLGFRTRKYYLRHPNNKNRIIGKKGNRKLDIKTMDRILRHPLYAGVTTERWTFNKPLKCQFNGLVSIEMFNQANNGRIMIFEENRELQILKGKLLRRRLVKTISSMRFPYKQLVLCAECQKPYYGSASRGRMGKYYPAYHCNKRGHYHRVSVKLFHITIMNYLSKVRIKDEYIDEIQKRLSDDKEKTTNHLLNHTENIDIRIQEINTNIELVVEKIKLLHSEVAIRSLEEELVKLEKEKKDLLSKQEELEPQTNTKKPKRSKEDQNKLPQELIEDHDVTKKERLFALLFARTPTYEDLIKNTALLKQEFELSAVN
jgi:hypothetical protein